MFGIAIGGRFFSSYTLTLISHDDNYTGDGTATLYDDVALNGGTPANDFSIAANPSSITVNAGQSGTSTISTTVTSGSAQTVNLSASGLPAGATATFNPVSVTAGGSCSEVIDLETAGVARGRSENAPGSIG